MSQLEVDKIIPQSGTTLTIGETGDTISFASGVLPSLESLTITGDLTVDTNTLYVDSTNNRVGVGTASPTSPLTVSTSSGAVGLKVISTSAGTLGPDLSLQHDSASPADNDIISLISFQGNDSGGTNTTYSQVRCIANDVTDTTEDGSLTILTTSAGTLAERMRIDSSGNVGIGTTSPSANLQINSTTINQPIFKIDYQASGNNLDGNILIPIDIEEDTTAGGTQTYTDIKLTNSSQATIAGSKTLNALHIDISGSNFGTKNSAIFEGGNVGIGTTSPSQHLQVGSGTADTRATFRPNNTFAIGFANGGNFGGWIGAAGTDILVFSSSGGSERMRIASSGNVGIGTTSPSSKLEVLGDIHAPRTATSSQTRTLTIGGARNDNNNSFANVDFENYDSTGTSTDFIGARISGIEDGSDDAALSFLVATNKTLSERMRIDGSGIRLTSSTSIRSMNVVELNNVTTGTSASSYTTRTEQGINIYATTHFFNYGFTALSSSKISLSIHQINSNAGGHTSKIQYDFKSLSTTGGTLVVSDLAGSASVNFRILVVEYV